MLEKRSGKEEKIMIAVFSICGISSIIIFFLGFNVINIWHQTLASAIVLIVFSLWVLSVICPGLKDQDRKGKIYMFMLIVIYIVLISYPVLNVFKDLVGGYEIIELRECQVTKIKGRRKNGNRNSYFLEGRNESGNLMKIKTDYWYYNDIDNDTVKGKYYKNLDYIVELEIIE